MKRVWEPGCQAGIAAQLPVRALAVLGMVELAAPVWRLPIGAGVL